MIQNWLKGCMLVTAELPYEKIAMMDDDDLLRLLSLYHHDI
jgi:hypothetical protein